MLSEKTLQLLTSFVDGELPPPRYKLAARVLQISSEARLVVKDLQENVHRLQELPKRTLEPEFAEQIVRILRHRAGTDLDRNDGRPEEPVREERPTMLPMRRRFSSGTRYAAAAALLLTASAGIYVALHNTPANSDSDNASIAKKDDRKETGGPDHGPAIAAVINGTVNAFGQPVPADRAGTQFAFSELKEKEGVTELAQTISAAKSAAKAVHLEVAVKDRAQAVRQLDKAFRGQNIKLVVDRVAEKKLNDPAAKTEYVLYAENITPAELTALLGGLAEGQTFETMTVSSATGEDQQQVALLMGIDRKQLEAPPPNVVDPFQKAIPKDSGNQPQIANIQNQAGPSTAPRIALVLANEGRQHGARLSSQVMSFLQSRRQAKPGTVQVIVIIHQI